MSKNNKDNNTKWLDKKSFSSAVLGAVLSAVFAFIGGIFYFNYEQDQLGRNIASQLEWEILDNITNIYNSSISNKQEETFLAFNQFDPESSILDTKSYYINRFSIRDSVFTARVGDLHLLKGGVLMEDVLNFYSMLHTVDENERQLFNVFENKTPLKVEQIVGISQSINTNTRRMRTIGAQAVGKIMYYYGNYDLTLKRVDSPDASTDEILADLYSKTLPYVQNTKKGDLINAFEIASSTQLLNSQIYQCEFSSPDMCALATEHYLILKTGMIEDKKLVYNGYIKK